MLDEQLLEQTVAALGARTYSAAVNQALAETVRRSQLERMTGFFGKDLWDGQLSEMREDRPGTGVR